MHSDFGLLLSRLIVARGMSLAAFARAVGLSPKTLSSFIHGHATMPIKRVEVFADQLGLTGAERETFVLEAHLTHATPLIREEFWRMREKGESGKVSSKASRARFKAGTEKKGR